MSRVAALALAFALTATAQAASASTLDAIPAPTVSMLHDVKLAATTVVQSIAYEPTRRHWFTAQVTPGQPTAVGAMTLTELDTAGRIVASERITNAGHGVSIGVEGGYLWTEFDPHLVGSWVFGQSLARFPFTPGATVNLATSATVARYRINAGALAQFPSVDMARGVLDVLYTRDGTSWSTAEYALAGVEHRTSYVARWRAATPFTGLLQGATVANGGPLVYTGGSSITVPAPGEATLQAFNQAGALTATTPVNAGQDPTYREPEGVTVAPGGNVCVGVASGVIGARTASIYCQEAIGTRAK